MSEPCNQIMIDADKLEHLLNCMAQLNFLPISGMHADEPIIRKAYQEAREMLNSATTCSVPPPPSTGQPSQSRFKPGQQVWSKASKTKYIVLDHFTNGLWQNGLWLIDLQATRVASLHDASDFTATDPNPPHKFKVGDTVWIAAIVQAVDLNDTELPYKVKVADDENLQWYRESDLRAAT